MSSYVPDKKPRLRDAAFFNFTPRRAVPPRLLFWAVPLVAVPAEPIVVFAWAGLPGCLYVAADEAGTVAMVDAI